MNPVTIQILFTSLLAFLWSGCGGLDIQDSPNPGDSPQLPVIGSDAGGSEGEDLELAHRGPDALPPMILDRQDSFTEGASQIVLLPRGSRHDSSLEPRIDDEGVVHLTPATDGCVKVEKLDTDWNGKMVNVGSYLECS